MTTRPSLGSQLAPLTRPFKAGFERQARRIDALSLRERVILFVCIVAVIAALFDTLVLSPLQSRGRQRAVAVTTQSNELNQLRNQFLTSSQGSPPPQLRQAQADLTAAQSARRQLDGRLAAHPAFQGGSGGTDAGLILVLQRLLDQHPGLSLSRIAFIEPPDQRASEVALPQLRWQGLEFQVDGPYPLLTPYLQALERQLPGLQWGELRLTAGAVEVGTAPTATAAPTPARLQAQLFVLRMPS